MVVNTYKRKWGVLYGSKLTYTLMAFVVCVVIFLLTGNPWAGHHFIYPYTFAILAISQLLSITKERSKTKILYTCASIVLALELFFVAPTIATDSSWERYKIFDFLQQEEIGKEYIITHLNWGTYYVSALYGHKEQLVIYIEPINQEEAKKVVALSKETGRKILCVCYGDECQFDKLAQIFNQEVDFEQVDLSTVDWKVYISYLVP